MIGKVKTQLKKVWTAIKGFPKSLGQFLKQVCSKIKKRWKKFVRKIATFSFKKWVKDIKKNPRKAVYNAISFALVLVIIFSGGKLLFNIFSDIRSNKQFEEIRDIVNNMPPDADVNDMMNGSTDDDDADDDTTPEMDGTIIEDEEGQPEYYEIQINGNNVRVPIKNLNWDVLKSINKDIYAWICVPGTDVDYPILQHPTENDYYLHMTLNHKYSLDGNIYTQVQYNKKDFSDFHTVLYGHNRRSNGKMFRTLHNFENEAVFKTYQYVFIYTEQGVYIYRIFAAYQTTSEHQIATYKTNSYSKVISYVERVMGRAEKTGFVRDFLQDEHMGKVLTLSTCVGDDKSERYLVQTMLVYDPTVQDDTE